MTGKADPVTKLECRPDGWTCNYPASEMENKSFSRVCANNPADVSSQALSFLAGTWHWGVTGARVEMKAHSHFYKLVCNSYSGPGAAAPSLIKPDDVPGHLCKVMLGLRCCQTGPNFTFLIRSASLAPKTSLLIANPSRGIILNNCRHFLGSTALLEEPRAVI